MVIYRLGNLGEITRNGGLHTFLCENHKKHGPMYTFYWGKELVVSVASPEIWKDMQTLFDRPCKLHSTLIYLKKLQ